MATCRSAPVHPWLYPLATYLLGHPVDVDEMTDDTSFDELLKDFDIPYHILDHSDNRFTDEERKYLTGHLKSMFAFVGCVVPDTITVDGSLVPLREIVWRLLTRKTLSENDLTLARELVSVLEGQVRERRKMIEEYSLSEEEAEKIFFNACGMLKALVTLRELEKNRTKGLDETMTEEKVRDAKQLMELIRRVL